MREPINIRQPMTWSSEDRRHMIDRPRFGLEEPAYREYVARHCLGLAPGMAMADIGCGSGASSLTLLPYLMPGGSLTGCDRDPVVLEYARENAAAAGAADSARYIQAEAGCIPVDNGAYDVTSCQTVLMHVSDPDAILAEMIRVTRPGGLVAATEPDWTTMSLRNLNQPPRAPEDAARWARAMALILEGGRLRGSGDWSIGSTLMLKFRDQGLASVRARSVPASWVVAPAKDGRRADGALRWAVELFYPEPGSDLNDSEERSHRAAGGTAAEWLDFEAMRARERDEILVDHERDHALLHVHTAAYLTTGRVPEPSA